MKGSRGNLGKLFKYLWYVLSICDPSFKECVNLVLDKLKINFFSLFGKKDSGPFLFFWEGKKSRKLRKVS